MATKSIGFVVELVGDAQVRSVDGIIRILKVGDPIYAGDVLSTGLNSEITLELFDGQNLQVGENTELLLDESVFAGLDVYPDARVDQLAELQGLIVDGFDLSTLEAPAADAPSSAGAALHQASIYLRDGTEGFVETRGTSIDFDTTSLAAPPLLDDGGNMLAGVSQPGNESTPPVISTPVPLNHHPRCQHHRG